MGCCVFSAKGKMVGELILMAAVLIAGAAIAGILGEDPKKRPVEQRTQRASKNQEKTRNDRNEINS